MVLPEFMWFIIFPISLVVLIKGSDWFTSSAEKIGLMVGIPQFIIGVTIVSIGTSLPELISSFIAVCEKASGIVPGNVVGSNIANIFLIFGIGAVVGGTLFIKYDIINIDLPLLTGSAFFTVLVCWDRYVSIAESVLLILGYAIFLAYTIQSRNNNESATEQEKPRFSIIPFLVVLGSSALIFIGAKFTIDAVIHIACFFHVGSEIVAVTAVALGTSLPELSVTISAVRKKNAEIIIGNIIGSNIFNTFAVLGLPGLFGGLEVPESLIVTGLPVLAIATLLFLVTTQDKQVSRWEGLLFVLFYILFIGKIINIF
ncbi:MAG: calcium/sodium antiporter [Spirochaetales bacterium]|nr:calcium/sodium antiporter [Spirochaetales bacterium]